jgi:glutamine cyclotransferase
LRNRTLASLAVLWLVLPGAFAAGPACLDGDPVYGYEIVNAYPHDPSAFTQGLAYAGGRLYEGTGLQGRSALREVDPASGRVLRERRLAPELFGEGVTVLGERVFQLTWQSGLGLVYALEDFAPVARFAYAGEGWGLTHDGRRLIMSDGSAQLRFIDPESLRETGRVTVRSAGRPVMRINELEYVGGEVWANLWLTEQVARIDPASGEVRGWIDLAGLSPVPPESRGDAVANGIAHDRDGGRLFFTGKLWPRLYELRIVPRGEPGACSRQAPAGE